MGKRVFLLVIDGFGVGEAPDAGKFGDKGSNTFVNLYKKRKLNIPFLTKIGLKNIDGVGLSVDENSIIGSYGKLQEKSNGKDTTTGHFEMMGIVTKYAMPTFPNGFPSEVVYELEKAFGVGILGNLAISGTEVIKMFGDEHIKTKKPIVYTSADSVLQIATHTDVYSIDKLYELCVVARKIMSGKNAVGRIIARPFMTNQSGEFVRINEKRRDFALSPEKPNTMSRLIEAKKEVIAVGKIGDIFNQESITQSYANHTNKDALSVTEKLVEEDFEGLAFVNLVDTDMVFGHRNDIEGYAEAIEQIDDFLSKLYSKLRKDDIVIITGDHGCDPTTASTDHSREYTPCLIYSKSLEKSVNLGTILGFDEIGKFIEKIFGLKTESVIYEKIFSKGE